MQLFPGEDIVSQLDDKTVTLTTHRIHQQTGGWNTVSTKSMMLEHITSCESFNQVVWVWLVSALLCFLIGVFMFDQTPLIGLGAFFFTLCCVVMFFLSKHAYIKVSSPSAVIHIDVGRMKKEKVHAFVDLIEKTKHERITGLSQKTST